MKSPLQPAIFAALLSASATAGATVSVDAYNEYLGARIQRVGVARAITPDTSAFVAQFLATPTSPYSAMIDRPAIVNSLGWWEFLSAMRSKGAQNAESILDTLRLQAGFTKARPGEEVTVSAQAIRAYRGREAAANAIKAGIDPDIFWQARDMSGSAITAAAGYALALQLLRDAATANAPADHARMAIRPDVLSRYLLQTRPQRIAAADLRYLADLLRGAIGNRGAPLQGTLGQRLPAAYRLARVAAAYSDTAGYFSGNGYCTGNSPRSGEPTGPDALDDNRPLCFIAATDRGALAWFRRQLRLDAAGLRIHENTHHGFRQLANLFGTVLILLDLVSFIETADALVADRLATEGEIDGASAELAAERANRLSCRISR